MDTPSPSPNQRINPPADPVIDPFGFPRQTDDTVKNARILIVDDEPAVAKMIGRHLTKGGFTSWEIETNSEHAFARVNDYRPDLILLDLRMHPVNGIEVLQQIRGNENTRHTPVIVVTTIDDELTTVTALNYGATDVLSKPVRVSELLARTRNTLASKAHRDLALQRSAQLESDLLLDPLTGIANRRAFEFEMKRRMTDWRRHRTPIGLAMLDLDRFKSVNDRYGHRVGDRVLCTVAKTLCEATRSMDLVARYGGEELAIILPSTTACENRRVASRVRQAVEALSIDVEGYPLEVTVSIGIANAMNGDDANLLIRRADSALYASKNNGRNSVHFHDGTECKHVCSNNQQSSKTEEEVYRPIENNDPSLAKVAIIDDEPTTILSARKHLKNAGFTQFLEISDPTDVLTVVAEEMPDIVLLDVHMPGANGLDLLKEFRANEATHAIPVLIFTSDTKGDAKVTALELGASDFLQKPLDPSELVARVRNTLLAKARLDDLAHHSQRLEYEVQVRTTELSASRREAIQCLARAAELRDDQTGQHVIRVGRYAAVIAEEMGFSEERVGWIELAAQLHDVGKIGVPDAILKKPGQLDADEYERMKAHTIDGQHIIRDNSDGTPIANGSHTTLSLGVFDDCNSPIMRMAALIAHSHHEKWDGSGYPLGICGEEIPIEGRITAVADVFDALSSKRPYKEAIDSEICFQMIADGVGTHFDPDVVSAFFARRSDVMRIYENHQDEVAELTQA